MTFIGYWDVSDKSARFMDLETFERLNKNGFTKTPNRRFIRVFADETQIEGSVNWKECNVKPKAEKPQKRTGVLHDQLELAIHRGDASFETWRGVWDIVMNTPDIQLLLSDSTWVYIIIKKVFVFEDETILDVLKKKFKGNFDFKPTDRAREFTL